MSSLILDNGIIRDVNGNLPVVGLGTATLKGERCIHAMKTAIDIGYRMIDTALLYGNQTDVGEGIKKSGIPREQLWITSKVGFFPSDSDKIWMYNPNNVKGSEESSIDLCLEQLGLDYVDLMLVHNPCTSAVEYSSASLPHFFEFFNTTGGSDFAIKPLTLPDGQNMRELILGSYRERCKELDSDEAYNRRKASWLALEKAQREGKCRYIGVSNYPAPLLEEMKSYATVLPSVNEVEFHPHYTSPVMLQVARDMGVAVIGYGTGTSMTIGDDKEVVQEIADRIGRTPMQVLLRWTLQKGVTPIPRSGSQTHLQENYSVTNDFELSEQDMQRLDNLNQNYPYYWDPVSSELTCSAPK